MSELFIVYMKNSLQLSAIALLILVASPLLAHRYSAKCRYYLWAVILVALLLPVRAKFTLELPQMIRSILPHKIEVAISDTALVVNTVNTWDWHNYAGVLWVAGIFCFLGWHLVQHLHFLYVVRRWNEDIDDAAVLELFSKVKAELGIREHITIKSCTCITTPMVIGLLHPSVLLPQSNLSWDELPLILKHELVHYKRKDIWYKVLMMLTLSIHWLNPVVYLIVKSVLNLCEISCDEEVLKGIGAKERARYGESVIDTVRNSGTYKTALSTNFYSRTKVMRKRIYAMMDMTNKRFSPVLYLVVLVVAMCQPTSFASSPAVPESMEQKSNQTMEADKVQNHVDTTVPTVTPDRKLQDPDIQSTNNSSLPSDESVSRLIPTYDDTPPEPSREQNNDPNRLIADKEGTLSSP